MAKPVVAQEIICTLRREIAKIEETPPVRLRPSSAGQDDSTVLRCGGMPARNEAACGYLRTGIDPFDEGLGGGIPKAAITEIHGTETRGAGAAAGFALSLASLLLKDSAARTRSPVLWIGTSEIFREAGFPYAPGLSPMFGLRPEDLLISEAAKLSDALWIAEETARLREFSAVFLEIRGNPARLDLTATRRLNRRAFEARRPLFLIREAAWPEPTAAPVRLVVSSAPAAARETLAGPLAFSIGHPAFTVVVSKGRTARGGRFAMKWNPDELCFEERRPENPGAVVSPSHLRPDIPPASGSVLAFEISAGHAPAGLQPSRKEHAAPRRTRRTG
jgi:protein ImuA